MKNFKKIISIILVSGIIILCVGCSFENNGKGRHSSKKDREETERVDVLDLEDAQDMNLTETSDSDFYSASATTVPEVNLPHDEAVALARADALDFIGFAHYSRLGLKRQLTSPYTYHFPEDVVEEAITSIEADGLVDWEQEAFELACSLIDSWFYSYSSLVFEMTYDVNDTGFAFTVEEARAAVARLENEGLVDWNEEALEAARSYLDYADYNREEMIEQLTFTGDMGDCFTREQALYAVDTLGME